MSPALVISLASLALAFTSFVVNFALTRRAAVRARKPVLIFIDDPDEECWVLRNLGNGPALNVLVALRGSGLWFSPVRLPPISKDGVYALRWLGRINTVGLGSSYTDFEGYRYTSTLGGEISRAYEGDRLPKWDDEREIKKYWELPSVPLPADPFARTWAPRQSNFQT
jgi:hypothetical protein